MQLTREKPGNPASSVYSKGISTETKLGSLKHVVMLATQPGVASGQYLVRRVIAYQD